MKKRRFTYAERYAVWHCHGHRCWLCTSPLRLEDTTIDHFFPESLLADEECRKAALSEYGLTGEFKINSFSNWLPCHARCNQAKGFRAFRYVPGNMIVLDRLIKLAPDVERTAREVSSDVAKDKVFGRLFAALERGTITTQDLRGLLCRFVEEPAPSPMPNDVILLDRRYWVHRKDVAREGECQCERETCVDSSSKVYCYFPRHLSPWVIAVGLYWKCYDEIVTCPRCSAQHKRGHIGKGDRCGQPFRDQDARTD